MTLEDVGDTLENVDIRGIALGIRWRTLIYEG